MKVCVLSSGSKGNSCLVMTSKTKILIDLGTTSAYVEKTLKNMGIDPSEIKSILITHTHSDHIKGLKTFINRYNPTIYVTKDILSLLNEDIGEFNYELYQDKTAVIDDLVINVIKISHDAPEAIGFKINHNDKSMVYITDTGFINSKHFKMLKNSNLYVLESNHDIKMLMDGPYPYYLKQRVRSDKGHLSNKQSSDYLCEFIGDETKKIVFAHLSEHNNSEEKVLETFRETVKKNNIDFDNVVIARQNECTELIEV